MSGALCSWNSWAPRPPRAISARCDYTALWLQTPRAPNGHWKSWGDLITNLLRSLQSQDFGSETLSPRQSQVLPVFDWKLLPQGLRATQNSNIFQNLSRLRRHGRLRQLRVGLLQQFALRPAPSALLQFFLLQLPEAHITHISAKLWK